MRAGRRLVLWGRLYPGSFPAGHVFWCKDGPWRSRTSSGGGGSGGGRREDLGMDMVADLLDAYFVESGGAGSWDVSQDQAQWARTCLAVYLMIRHSAGRRRRDATGGRKGAKEGLRQGHDETCVQLGQYSRRRGWPRMVHNGGVGWWDCRHLRLNIVSRHVCDDVGIRRAWARFLEVHVVHESRAPAPLLGLASRLPC